MLVNGVDYATLIEIEKKYKVVVNIDSYVDDSNKFVVTVGKPYDKSAGCFRFDAHYDNSRMPDVINAMVIAGVLTCIKKYGIEVEGGITW